MPAIGRRILKGAAVLSTGQVACYSLSFVRNLILARLLTKADFGLAAALSVSLSLLELVSRMSFGTQIIQAPDGDQPEYQKTAHAVQAVVGVLSALLVLAIAWPMATIFHQPGLTWAFAAMAIVPLARGFVHLDMTRFQRGLNYGPQAITEVVPQVLATIVAWPLAAWLRNFQAVLWIMLGKEILTLAMSHLLAERPYCWNWRHEYVKRMWTFGWPLLLNGLLMVGAQQGDQIIVGAGFSVEDLAIYFIAFTLTTLPWAIFSQVGGSLMLPLLSQRQDDRDQFRLHYRRCLDLSVIGSLLIVGPLIIAGDPLVRLMYGPKYSGTGSLIAVFGAIVALRLFRWTPALAALARADTMNQLFGNIARATSLPLALLLVGIGTRNLALVAACGLVGEAISTIATLRLVRDRQGIGWLVHTRPLGFLVFWLTSAAIVRFWIGEGASIWMSGIAMVGLWAAAAMVAAILLPDAFALYRRVAVAVKPALLFGRH